MQDLRARLPTPVEELLGMLLREPSAMGEYALDDEMFYEYGWLYKEMKSLHEHGMFTLRNLTSKLPERLGVIQQLHGCVMSSVLIAQKADEVKALHFRKRLSFTLQNALSDCNSDRDIADVYRSVVTKLDRLDVKTSKLVNQEQKVQEWLEWVEMIRTDPSKAYGLRTGIHELDMLTTGFHRHDLSIVGARTSMGKSAFMIEMVLRLAKKGYKTAIFSLEMTRNQVLNRMIANLTRTRLMDLKKGEIDETTFRMMKMESQHLKEIYIDDSRGVSADDVTDVMRTLKRRQGLDFVVVDYLQDVKEKGEEHDNLGSALARVCRKLRKGAYDCDCHVMALSQVKREVEQRNDKRPGNSDLSGSTGIETSADVIALLYRDEYYHPKTDKPGIIEVNFTKQRNGQVGRVELQYDKDIQRMYGRYER